LVALTRKLWKKGETSGQTQTVVRIRTDCDQDVVVIDVQVNGDGAACHTGRATCFYREVGTDGALNTIDDTRLLNPDDVYGR
jgi:phosphoribosyl-AMP cyclohydrolase